MEYLALAPDVLVFSSPKAKPMEGSSGGKKDMRGTAGILQGYLLGNMCFSGNTRLSPHFPQESDPPAVITPEA